MQFDCINDAYRKCYYFTSAFDHGWDSCMVIMNMLALIKKLLLDTEKQTNP